MRTLCGSIRVILLALVLVLNTGFCKITNAQSNSYNADLIIYGGTSDRKSTRLNSSH